MNSNEACASKVLSTLVSRVTSFAVKMISGGHLISIREARLKNGLQQARRAGTRQDRARLLETRLELLSNAKVRLKGASW
eukprot:3878183-Amphidinium_carterae.1